MGSLCVGALGAWTERQGHLGMVTVGGYQAKATPKAASWMVINIVIDRFWLLTDLEELKMMVKISCWDGYTVSTRWCGMISYVVMIPCWLTRSQVPRDVTSPALAGNLTVQNRCCKPRNLVYQRHMCIASLR